MSRIRSVLPDDDLRVIMCLVFDHRAPCEDVSAFKRCIVECPHVLHSVEVMGPFDFMVEASLRDMSDYNEKMASVAAPLARLVSRYEACFVCKRYIREEKPDRSIWVPTTDGARRIECSHVDKITAEGDYMRVHCGEQGWLVHTTLKAMLERLDPGSFVQVHRSVVVRADFIESLVHHGKRWSAQLKDGTRQHIAKSHVGMVLETLRVAPPKPEAHSSTLAEVNEKMISVAE